MNKKLLIAIGIVAAVIIGLVGIRLTTAPPKYQAASNSTDPQYTAPGLYPNQIVNNSTAPGIVIKQAITENNVDAKGNVVDDHLQLTLGNTTSTTMSNLEVYYVITDTKTGQKESYDTKLTGMTIAPGAAADVHFDNGSGSGHFPFNKNSILATPRNILNIEVEVSAPGYAPQQITVKKAAGGSDKVD
ncbi:MAG: hypothetical protein JWP06_622 [Candidatus Saccharibacteria bacterium]|jgi:hypothetical protein|nr:hypothetical protein [Candidatus Saccharibacteria bacterium]